MFVGGCSLEAVEAICALPDASGGGVLEALYALADLSLLQVRVPSAGGEPRYAMLETVREYGLEQLVESGEAEAVRDGHAAWYLALAEAAVETLQGERRQERLDQLELERGNLRAALAWCAREDPTHAGAAREQLLRLATALGPFWEARGPLNEGRRWLEAAVVAGATAPAALRVRALTAAARLAVVGGDGEPARRYFEASLVLARATDDRRGAAAALIGWGEMTPWKDWAAALFEEGLALWRELGDRAEMATALGDLAGVTI